MFLNVTDSCPFAWWYSIVPMLLSISPHVSFFIVALSCFNNVLACSSLCYYLQPIHMSDCQIHSLTYSSISNTYSETRIMYYLIPGLCTNTVEG